MEYKKIKDYFWLIVILIGAAIVRYWGIGFGLPNTNCRPDEWYMVDSVTMPVQRFYPGSFVYPCFYQYLNLFCYGLYFLFGLFTGRYNSLMDFTSELKSTNFVSLYFIDRLLSAAFGVATVFICYKIAERFFNKKTALISAFFLSFTYLHVRDSHFGTVDVPMTCLMMVSIFFIMKYYEENSMRDYRLAGIFAGLAVSTKYSAVLLIVPMFVVNGIILAATQGKGQRFAQLRLAAKRTLPFIAIMAGVFVLLNPYSILDMHKFVEECLGILQGASVSQGIDLGRGWWYHLRFSLFLGMGSTLFFAALAGILLLIKIDKKKAIVWCAFPLAYYLVAGAFLGVFLRWAVPFIPYLCITAAVFTAYILDALKKYCGTNVSKILTIILPCLMVAPSVYNIAHFDMLLLKKDNRLIATEWIDKNLPAGSSLALRDSGYGILLTEGKKFVQQELTDRPKYLVIQKSALKAFPVINREEEEFIQKSYRLVAEFKAMNINNPDNWFDQDDNFFIPFTGFKDIQRPGPNFCIYERK